MLTQISKVTAVIEASTFDELIDQLDAQNDVGLVLLDLNMQGMNDVESLTRLQNDYPTTAFAIITGIEVATVAQRFLEAGAAGYIPKSANSDVLRGALELILSGNIYVPPFALKRGNIDKKHPLKLTDRQFDVLTLMVQGYSNKAIALTFDITESTVKNHSSAILKAFKVDNRVKATHEAIRLGIVETP